jgi:hypothetical protein
MIFPWTLVRIAAAVYSHKCACLTLLLCLVQRPRATEEYETPDLPEHSDKAAWLGQQKEIFQLANLEDTMAKHRAIFQLGYGLMDPGEERKYVCIHMWPVSLSANGYVGWQSSRLHQHQTRCLPCDPSYHLQVPSFLHCAAGSSMRIICHG